MLTNGQTDKPTRQLDNYIGQQSHRLSSDRHWIHVVVRDYGYFMMKRL